MFLFGKTYPNRSRIFFFRTRFTGNARAQPSHLCKYRQGALPLPKSLHDTCHKRSIPAE